MSLSGSTLYSDFCDGAVIEMALADSANAARDAGITLFAASGNNASGTAISSPACLSAVLAVGSVYDANVGGIRWGNGLCTDMTTQADKVVCSSNVAPILDLLAPGALIVSSDNDGGVTMRGGTSMASPHAAGLAALLLGKSPRLSPENISGVLKSTGKAVYDQRIGMNFPRVAVLAALDLVGDADLSVALADTPDPVVEGNILN